MKTICLLVYILSCLQAIAQQSNLNGIVSIFNSETNTGKRQYVSNAQIEDDFGKAQPVVTNVNGQFVLAYVGVEDKRPVSFQVKKPGLQVVNIDALNAVTGQQERVKISMAHPDDIAEYRRRIYLVGKTEAEKQLEGKLGHKSKEIELLQKNSALNGNRIKELQQDLYELEGNRRRIEGQAQELARKYAPVNLDDASPFFKQAFSLFQKGQLDSAILVLTRLDLAEKVYQVLAEREKLTRLQNEIGSRDSLQKQRAKDIGTTLQFKADLHITRYEFDSSAKCYNLLMCLDSTNPVFNFNYARFLTFQNEPDKAITYLLKALKIYKLLFKDSSESCCKVMIAWAQLGLGALYMEKKEFAQSETALQQALKIYENLAASNLQIFKPNIATAQNYLGRLYNTKNEFEKAHIAFSKALEIYKAMVSNNQPYYESFVASTEMGLGENFLKQKNYNKAEKALLNALDIFKRFVVNNPYLFEPALADIQNSLGGFYQITNDHVKAEATTLNALEIFKRLAKNNPHTYMPRVAATYHNLGIIYGSKGDYMNADTNLILALKIYQDLAKYNPQTYNPEAAKVKINLGNTYALQNIIEKAEIMFLEALDIYNMLAQKNPKTYKPIAAMIQINLGNIYSSKSQVTKAEAYYQLALETYKYLSLENLQVYELQVAIVEKNLGSHYLKAGNYGKSEEYLLESIKIFSKWMNNYPKIYSSEVASVLGVLVDLYAAGLKKMGFSAFKGNQPEKFSEIEPLLLDACNVDAGLTKKLANHYGNRAWFLLFASKFTEAEDVAQKAIKLDPTQIWIKTNLAHSLLFQGRFTESLNVYGNLKYLRDATGTSYAAICLEDLEELEKQGITHKDVERIKAFLKKIV